MPRYKYDHVHLISPTPFEAAAFYEQVFNAKRVSVGKYPDGGTRVELNIEGTRIIIRSLGYEGTLATDNPQKRYGLEHICFGTDDIEAAVADLKKKGARFVRYDRKIIKYVTEEIGLSLSAVPEGNKVVFVMAPDNVLIELSQRPREYFLGVEIRGKDIPLRKEKN